MLKPSHNSKMSENAKTPEKIKLGQTFYKLEKGEVSVKEVAARKKAEKEARRAEIIKKGGIPDKTDPFMGNYEK